MIIDKSKLCPIDCKDQRSSYHKNGHIDPATPEGLEKWIAADDRRQRAANLPGARTHAAIRQRVTKLAKLERDALEDRLRHSRLAAHSRAS